MTVRRKGVIHTFPDIAFKNRKDSYIFKNYRIQLTRNVQELNPLTEKVMTSLI